MAEEDAEIMWLDRGNQEPKAVLSGCIACNPRFDHL